MRTLWTIRDYPRLSALADACLAGTPDPTETPEIQRQRNLRATESNSIRYAELMRTIRIIQESLLEVVQPEDRKAIFDNIVHGTGWPLDKGSRTYGRIKQAYIYEVAKRLHYI